MNKEQIDDLCDYVENRTSSIRNSIIDWFEQTPVETKVVGFTDGQIKEFANYYGLSVTEQTKLRLELSKWQKTQNFAQPVVKEIPVGLTNEQIQELVEVLDVTQYDYYQSAIQKWQKTQNFVISQQFQPDWDDAPKDAVTLRVWAEWIDCNDMHCEFIIREEQRPTPPAPVVEVGQVWVGDCFFYATVKETIWLIDGSTKEKREVVILEISSDYYRYDIDDFLTKFERVS